MSHRERGDWLRLVLSILHGSGGSVVRGYVCEDISERLSQVYERVSGPFREEKMCMEINQKNTEGLTGFLYKFLMFKNLSHLPFFCCEFSCICFCFSTRPRHSHKHGSK